MIVILAAKPAYTLRMASPICFRGAVVLPDRVMEEGTVVCEGDRIVSVGHRQPRGVPVVEGHYIVPGYVDLHVHGGGGADYMDGTPEAVRTVNRVHLRHGSTTLFPTTTTGTTGELARMLRACAEVRRNW